MPPRRARSTGTQTRPGGRGHSTISTRSQRSEISTLSMRSQAAAASRRSMMGRRSGSTADSAMASGAEPPPPSTRAARELICSCAVYQSIWARCRAPKAPGWAAGALKRKHSSVRVLTTRRAPSVSETANSTASGPGPCPASAAYVSAMTLCFSSSSERPPCATASAVAPESAMRDPWDWGPTAMEIMCATRRRMGEAIAPPPEAPVWGLPPSAWADAAEVGVPGSLILPPLADWSHSAMPEDWRRGGATPGGLPRCEDAVELRRDEM
mmetsp:Transcript_11824/g.35052  ORF Transcript_11824/g.35052 Transcript_11824/m.35052 type:complete len:268 (-) Transcript_11824:1610-2413(-)